MSIADDRAAEGAGASFSTPLYPNTYVWFVLASALDVMLTSVILHLGGGEANGVARWVIERYDIVGMSIFKFTLVILVILICQWVGLRNRAKGRRLAEWAVALTFVPVVFSLVLILVNG